MSGSADLRPIRHRRFRLLTHGLVALVAMVAAHFYLFYGRSYLFPPSFVPSPGCSPATVSFLPGNGKGEKIRMEKSNCPPDSADVALYLDDANGKSSRPFLIFGGQVPVVRATWVSPDSVSLDIVGDDISIDYARDRVRGIHMNYTMRPAPPGAPAL